MACNAESNTSSKKTFFYISFLNVFSALAVIMLHANGTFWKYRNDSSWMLNNIIECLFYFAVPIFFMLTGATLLDYQKKYDTKTFFKRRFTKILIPFTFWSIFGIFYYAIIEQYGWEPNINDAFNALFSGCFVNIFWFFPPLICIYLTIPLFSAIKENKKQDILKYLVVVGFLLNILVPFLLNTLNYAFKLDLKWPYEFCVMSGFLIYPVIGYLLHNIKLTKKQRKIIYTLAVFSLFVHIFGTYFLSVRADKLVTLFKGYLNAPCFFYSIGLFVFIKQLSNSEKFVAFFKKPVLFLQRYSFAFYLLHFFVIKDITRLLATTEIQEESFIYVIIRFILTILICIIATFIIRKIPKIGKLILP